MPIYEYYCRSCEQKFERLLPMAKAENAVPCPVGQHQAVRVISLVAAHSKGAEGVVWPAGGGCACGSGGACACGGH